jgi:hypothetical protein
MKLVGRRLLLFLLTLLSPAVRAQAAHSVQLSDRDGLFVASFTGDQNKLSQVAGTAKGGADVIAKALYLRSTYCRLLVNQCHAKLEVAGSFCIRNSAGVSPPRLS